MYKLDRTVCLLCGVLETLLLILVNSVFNFESKTNVCVYVG